MSQLFNRVNWIDVIALILLIRIAYVSSKIGVGKQILPSLLLLLILVFSLYFIPLIAVWTAETFFISYSLCTFLFYIIILAIFFVIYRISLFLSGLLFTAKEIETAKIEQVGGTIIGLLRATFIIGLVMLGLLFMPIRFIEQSVKDSYSGTFFINLNINIYNSLINLIFRNDKLSHRKTLSVLFSKKDRYLFESLDLKEKSRFFKEGY